MTYFIPIDEGIVKKNLTKCRRVELHYAQRNVLLLSDDEDHEKIRYGGAQEDKLHFVS